MEKGHIIYVARILFLSCLVYLVAQVLSGVCVVLFVFGDRSTGKGDTRHVTRSEIFGNFIDWETKKGLEPFEEGDTTDVCLELYEFQSTQALSYTVLEYIPPFQIPQKMSRDGSKILLLVSVHTLENMSKGVSTESVGWQ